LQTAAKLFSSICLAGCEKPQDKQDPFLNLVICCDIDAQDHNGAIHQLANRAIQSKVPLITSKALLSEIDNDFFKSSLDSLNKLIASKAGEWDFYLEGELVLCIPKDYPFTIEQLLGKNAKTDLKKAAHWSKVLEGPTGKAKVSDLTKL